MVSLTDIYNLKESVLDEIGRDRDPSRGNKGKSREKEFYFVDEPLDRDWETNHELSLTHLLIHNS